MPGHPRAFYFGLNWTTELITVIKAGHRKRIASVLSYDVQDEQSCMINHTTPPPDPSSLLPDAIGHNGQLELFICIYHVFPNSNPATNCWEPNGLPHFGFQNKCGGDLHFKLMFVSFYEIK